MTSTQSFSEPWPTSDASILQSTDKPRLLRVSFVGPEADGESPHRHDNERILAAAIAILTQGEDLLKALSVASFSSRVPAVFNASMGGHYRHCLDHFRTLLEAAPQGDLNYDHRERGTLVENDRFAALNTPRANSLPVGKT